MNHLSVPGRIKNLRQPVFRSILSALIAVLLIVIYILFTAKDVPQEYPKNAVASALSVSVPKSGQANWRGWSILSSPTFGFSTGPDYIIMKFALALSPSASAKPPPILTLWVPSSATNLRPQGCSKFTRRDYVEYSLSELTCSIDRKHLVDGPYIVAGGNLTVDFIIALTPYVLTEGVGRKSVAIGMSRIPNIGENINRYSPFGEVVASQDVAIEENWGFKPRAGQRFTFVPDTTEEMVLALITDRGKSRVEYASPAADFSSDNSSFWKTSSDNQDFVADIHLVDDGVRRQYELIQFLLAMLLGMALGPLAAGSIAWLATMGGSVGLNPPDSSTL